MPGIMPHQERHVRCGMRWKQPFFLLRTFPNLTFSGRNILLAEGQPKNQKQARTPVLEIGKPRQNKLALGRVAECRMNATI